MKNFDGAAADVDEQRNWESAVRLGDLWGEEEPQAEDSRPTRQDVEAAISEVAAAVAGLVPEEYRRFVCAEQLVAIQPNCHNGQGYLPLHLDDPGYEGFGVVIVTIAIEGAAAIVLESGAGAGASAGPAPQQPRPSWSFHLREGSGYAISGFARNRCVHGVLAEEGSSHRRSLNFRFGLHRPTREEPFSFFSEVERHWGASA
jgi:hypothetical protein